MTSIPDLASRPAFKLDMICQKLQQETGTDTSELSPTNPGGDTALNGDTMASGQRSEPDEDPPPAEEDEPEEEEDDDEHERDEERRPGESDSDTVDWGAGGGDESWPWPSATMSTDQSHQASPRASPRASPTPLPLSSSPHASPTGEAGDHPTPDTGRRNKRKNFQPRAIVYQYAEAAAEVSGETRDSFSETDEQALDLTESRAPPRPSASEPAPMDLTVRTPTQINSALPGRPPAAVDPSEMKRYAENTMRELLGIYGFPSDPSEAHQSPAGKLFEHLTGRLPPAAAPAPSGGGRTSPQQPPHQPPTPPHTPRAASPGQAAALEQERRRLLARTAMGGNGLLLPQNMATLLTFAALNKDRGLAQAGAHGAPAGTPVPPSGVSPANGLPFPSPATTATDRRNTAVDYGRYVRRFTSAQECGFNHCIDLSYREHFHCLECNSRVFVKKEEMIRHFKWHKKRDDSLQHGFMRYSPTDDCGDRYPDCSHNRKQTHYHCLKEGCDKVYISTSDVQMHANYHRKDSAIQQEGFQRFRASEDCGVEMCSYQGQRTTHFHCKRPGCSFTFKNKADMEKHKTYHIKDEQLNKDGFKKYIKHEHCPFENCRFSKVCNHIHCIRPGCSYVLHSSGQLYSHKMSHFQRKHERQDSEMAYRNYRLSQSLPRDGAFGEQFPLAAALSRTVSPSVSVPGSMAPLNQPSPSTSPGSVQSPLPASPSDALKASPYGRLGALFPGMLTPSSFALEPLAPQDMKPSHPSELPRLPEAELMQRFVLELTDGATCAVTGCEFSGTAHYHCSQPECGVLFQSRDSARDHARNHEQQQHVTATYYEEVAETEDPCPCQPHCLYRGKERHYHCNWEGCTEVILRSDKPFRRLDHYKMHDYSRRLAASKESSGPPPVPPLLPYISPEIQKRRAAAAAAAAAAQAAKVSAPFEVPMPGADAFRGHMPPGMFGSFKLPKPLLAARSADLPGTSPAVSAADSDPPRPVVKHEADPTEGFREYREGATCTDADCAQAGRRHYHCAHPRCFFASSDTEDLTSHARDFHDNVDILEGFVFFNRDVDCKMAGCLSNKVNRHFHCTRPGCGHSFVRYLAMAEHDKLHRSQQATGSPPPTSNGQTGSPIVKAAGTYYPLSAFATPDMPQGLVLHSRLTEQRQRSPPTLGAASPRRSRSPTELQAQGERSDPATSAPLPAVTQHPGTDLMSRLLQSPATLKRPTAPSVAESFSHFQEEQPCGRPFCKLKRREHYHCELCNQAFSEAERLHPHLERHAEGWQSPQTAAGIGIGGIGSHQQQQQQQQEQRAEEQQKQQQQQQQQQQEEQEREQRRNIPGAEVVPEMPRHPMLPFHPFAHASFLGSPEGFLLRPALHPALAGFPMMPPQNGGFPLPMSAAMFDPALLSRKRLSGDGPGDGHRPEVKKPRNMRILKDEPVPDGYIRFRFNEDCKYPHCGYREHQTHFHCIRKDCGYSFCDKTRFVQHTARHERLDTLMGGDFVQYRANIPCGRDACIYTNTLDQRQNKASHFHCLKCEFVCTDTNKVVAHRRQHTKLDSITQAGFEKFTPSQSCKIETCNHNGKQTHYHCVKCQYSVLGLSQMSAHKYRHME
ncbi:zinc finger protein castor homolog 1-like isoform X2 [Amphibalanus amphitrite]|uniref:zinc finger protein castor homolog 1-like isoform X2 n=1 Tax=Amphibalanus amphitrite TaxID=1232801 RepID=UPI001C9093E8|nr:zinc finger protein castor homolog 1-like isoform X2 [Amphibalanus amphitrite]